MGEVDTPESEQQMYVNNFFNCMQTQLEQKVNHDSEAYQWSISIRSSLLF